MTSEIECFHRYWNSASQTPRYPLNIQHDRCVCYKIVGQNLSGRSDFCITLKYLYIKFKHTDCYFLNETNLVSWMPFTCMLSNAVRYSSNFKNFPSIDKLIIGADQKVLLWES